MGVVWIIKQHYPTAGERNKVATIRLLKHRLVEHELCWAVGNDPPGEGDHIVEALRGAGEIVRGGNDRAATRRLGVKDVHDLLLRRGIHAGYRFVKQINLRISGDRTCQEDPATLTTRELANLAPRKISHINTRERICHRSVIGGAGPTERSKGRGTTHHHHLAD